MQTEKVFDVLNCIDKQKVSFATFMLEGEADHLEKLEKRLLAEEDPLTWGTFLESSQEKYFLEALREQK